MPMTGVAYASPWVPAEWIAAHGLQPDWMRLAPAGATAAGERRGVCPYASALVEAVASGVPSHGLVLATTCDQMRYAAAVLQREARLPVFLMNVPSTCDDAARELYCEELARLGSFLESLGGRRPSDEQLADVVFEYGRARAAVLDARQHLSARETAKAMLSLRRGEIRRVRACTHANREKAPGASGSTQSTTTEPRACVQSTHPTRCGGETDGIRLALLGGPLAEDDFELLDLVESAGGRIVLDASEGGERTLPATPDVDLLREDPLAELARIYFDAIPDCFRRPNDALYGWLAGMLVGRQVRGILFRRYVWCDLWHAELARLRERSPVPVLELDVGNGDHGGLGRTTARVEAFLEMLAGCER